MSKLIAISFSDYDKCGCVNCGCDYCYAGNISCGGSTPVTCGECRTDFVILANGKTESCIGFNGENGECEYPSLQAHPRDGILKHKYVKPDIRPDGEGEFWSPRGVGYGKKGEDISGFIKSKQAGERILIMIENIVGKEHESWLDYREHEPNWIQLKVEEFDGFDVAKLYGLCKDGIITEERLRKSYVGKN